MSMINPYTQWLNVPSDGSRPDHYELLGLPLFEQNPTVISQAAQCQVAAVGPFVASNKKLAQRVLREIEEARLCLMDAAARAAYDAQLSNALGGMPTEIEPDPSQAPVAQAAAAEAVSGTAANLLPPGAAPVTQPKIASVADDDDDDEDLPVANLAEDLLPPGVAPVHAQPAVPVARSAQASTPVAQVAPQVAVQARPAATHAQVRSSAKRQRGSGPPAMLLWGSAAALLLLLGGVGMYVAGVGPFARDETVADNSDIDPSASNSGKNNTNGRDTTKPAAEGNSANNNQTNTGAPNTTPPASNGDSNAEAMPPSNTTTETPPNRTNTKPDDATIAAIQSALSEARSALGAREFETAKAQIATAAELDATGQFKQEIEAAQLLSNYIDTFWATVRSSVGALQPADQITLGETPIGIVVVDNEGLIIRRDGRNERHDFATMSSDLAYALTSRAFEEDSSTKKLLLSAFLIVDPRGNRQRAAELLADVSNEDAAAAALLRTELDLAMLADAERPTTDADSVGEPETAGPAFGERVAAPEEQAITAAILQLKDDYKEQLAAQQPEQHLELAQELREAAKSEPDAARRYGLLQLAIDQAALAGNVIMALDMIDLTGDYFEVDILELKIAQLARGAQGPQAGREAVALAALDLADEAILLDRYPEAVRLARTAQTAAKGLGNSELLKAAAERTVAFGELAREERSR